MEVPPEFAADEMPPDAAAQRERLVAELAELRDKASKALAGRGKALVHGERQEVYGHPYHNFTRIGRMWGGLLGIPDIPPALVAMMLENLKQAREVHAHQDDNLDDIDGYNECHRLVRMHEDFREVEWPYA